MVIRRLFILIATLGLVASACSSDGGDQAGGDDDTEVATESSSPESGDGDGDDGNEEERPTTSIGSQTGTTFIPALEGPFSTDGGATSGENADQVEINPDGGPPPQLVSLTWPTDWTRTTVDAGDLISGLGGSDPRDGIPPIDDPTFETVESSAGWLADGEPGALVQLNGEARFYPLSIMTRHEVVNDAFGDVPVSVTFCPLCNTAIAFDRRVDGEVLRFGVSGLLRNSDLVMWDDKTTSLWQQITGESIVGDFAGTQLEAIPTSIVSFGDFAAGFPEGKALSPGQNRERYGVNPYAGYSSSTRPFLFAGEPDDRFPALSRVVAVTLDDEVKAFPFEFLTDEPAVNDQIGDTPFVVLWGGGTQDALDQGRIVDSQVIGSGVAYLADLDGQELTFAVSGDDSDLFVDDQTGSTWNILGQAVEGELAGQALTPAPHRNEFWFAFAAFFPDAEVFSAS